MRPEAEGQLEERSDDAPDLVAELTRLLEGDEPVSATLQHVAQLMPRAVPDCDACGITTLQDDSPVALASTDDTARRLEETQCEAGEGPTLDAIREKEQVRMGEGEGPWPRFRAAVAEAGMRTVVALPIDTDQPTPAALTLYSSASDAFCGKTNDVLDMFARHASVALRNAHVYGQCLTLVGQLKEAMATRAVIEQAKGILIEREHCSPDEAFDLLRRASQRVNKKLRDVARAIVDRAANETKRPPPDSGNST